VKFIVLEVALINVGDLQLPARGRLERFRDLHDLVIVEIQAGDRIVGFRLCGFFLDIVGLPFASRWTTPLALRILHPVSENRGARSLLRRFLEHGAQIVAVKDIVAERRAQWSPPMNFSPMRNACAMPLGSGCSSYVKFMPQRVPSRAVA